MCMIQSLKINSFFTKASPRKILLKSLTFLKSLEVFPDLDTTEIVEVFSINIGILISRGFLLDEFVLFIGRELELAYTQVVLMKLL